MAVIAPADTREVVLNGVTAVTVVAAPASGKARIVHDPVLVNLDSVDHTFSLGKKKAATTRLVTPDPITVAAGQSQMWEGIVDLVATDETVVAYIEAAHTTTAPVVIPGILELPNA